MPHNCIYNHLLFSPPDATPGQSRWQEWQPELTKRLGAKSCSWLFHDDLFPGEGAANKSAGWIDESKVRANLENVPREATLILNVEAGPSNRNYWGTINADGMELHPPGVEHRRKLLAFLRGRRPDLRIGYYSVLPHKWHGLINGTVSGRERWRRWCRELTPLADDVDFLVPQCYPDSDWTVNYTRLYLARSIMACRDFWPNKPVYPLLWMEHYDLYRRDKGPERWTVEGHRSRLIPVEWWRMEMETCRQLGDGFILWGGNRVPWPGGAAWWQATKDFLIRQAFEAIG